MLVHTADGERLRRGLAERGVAVRRGDTFPGLGPDHLRVAVRGSTVVDRLLEAVRGVRGEVSGGAHEPAGGAGGAR